MIDILGRYIMIFGVFIIIVIYFDIPLRIASTIAIMNVLESIKGNLEFFNYCYEVYTGFTLSSKRLEDFLQSNEIENFLKDTATKSTLSSRSAPKSQLLLGLRSHF